jgi:hypothetical protein
VPLPPANPRPTCSYCCKPFTDKDPGRIVGTHTYLLSTTAPESDPSQPTCVVVKLAPDCVLCRDCFRQFGCEERDEVRMATPRRAGQEGGTGDSGHQREGSQPATNPRRTTGDFRLENWALAIEHGDAWHIFRKFGSAWRHHGRAEGLARGRQEQLLGLLADNGGFLSDYEAVKWVRATFSDHDRKQIMKIIKPELSRLRKFIRRNLNVTGARVDPLPRDKHARGWRAVVQIGYAVKNDDGRLEFTLREVISGGEQLDFAK